MLGARGQKQRELKKVAPRKKARALVTHTSLFFPSPHAPAGARLNLEVLLEALHDD